MNLPSIPTPSGNVPASNFARISVETVAVRWRDDGTDPTTTAGMPVAAGSSFDYDGSLNAIKIIPSAAGTCTINVSYYRVNGPN